MAKRERDRGSSGESSNTGLIVTLVFFILATIGLGVGTYMGFGAKADAVKDAKSANDKASASDKKAEEAEARRLGVKIAAGVATDDERKRFASIKGPYASAITADVTAVFSTVAGQLGSDPKDLPVWNPSTSDQPPKSLLAFADELKKQTAAAETARKAAVDGRNADAETAKQTIQGLESSLKNAEEAKAKANKDLLAEQQTRAGGSDQKDADIKRLSEELAQAKLEKQNVETERNRQVTKLQKELETSRKVRTTLAEKYGPLLEKLDQVRQARPELRELQELLDVLRGALEGQSSIVNDVAKGEVVSVKNGQVYISLGTADNVHPGLTFSVLPNDATGRGAAIKDRKGAIEIVSALEPHLSVAKVVEAGNPARDPLLPHDKLFNPAFDPSQPVHVALAGIFDLNGSGTDNTADLVRNLEKQGVVVDAWLDLRDRTIKGPGITERTTYLIKGERPVLPQGVPAEGNTLGTAIIEAIGKITDMENKARELGVQTVPYRRFFSLIGYKLPKPVANPDYGSSSYLRGPNGVKPVGDSGNKPAGKNKDNEDKPK
jgi:hypothetical protein